MSKDGKKINGILKPEDFGNVWHIGLTGYGMKHVVTPRRIDSLVLRDVALKLSAGETIYESI